ncbi:MAG: hypothetical protein MJE68_23210 [Proteobacteria bacterium]|nr:hypothetical protein [Pseudomonadota bacterium]
MAHSKTTKPRNNAALVATHEDEKIALALERMVRRSHKITRDLKITKWMAIIGFSAYVILVIVCLYFLIAAFLQY